MSYLLFPGRHQLLTNFQRETIQAVCTAEPSALHDVDGRPLALREPIDAVLWAVTSANHGHTRRNPLPAHRREAAIEALAAELPVESFVYLIDDVGQTRRFAEYVLKKIEVDSQGRHRPTPADTVVGCSTPEVLELYEALGFAILPFELIDRRARTYRADTPWHLLNRLVEHGLAGGDWRTADFFTQQVAPATQRLYRKYHYGDLIVDLHRQPLLTADGDITATRDYNTYVRSFDAGAARKYAQLREHVLPGRIVDIGCCTGSLLRELAADDKFRESDLYGIEAARPLYAECLHRKEQGAFADTNVFFYQRDFAAGPVFPDHTVDTFITCALTHEIESYLGRARLEHFFGLMRRQLGLGRRWLNLDVVGPEDGDRVVWLRLNDADGRNDDWNRTYAPDDRAGLRDDLAALSTLGRFLRFAADFRRGEGYRLAYELRRRDGATYAVTTLRDACEFLSKKDYVDNWLSEMHETFCFWSFGDWCRAVEAAGLRVAPASHAYVNPWLVENRFRGRAELFVHDPVDDRLTSLDYPPTNMLLVVENVEVA